MKPLHIAASLRIVAKHTHIPKISLVQAREAIQRVAVRPLEQDRLMVEELERVTGVPIAELGQAHREVAAVVRPIEHWKWWITDPDTGKRKKTTWRMNREEALKHDPNAEPVEGTREIRNLPVNPDEWNVARKDQLRERDSIAGWQPSPASA